MSKFVKIPSYQNPCEIIINGMKYQYPAGQICLVPDEVAMVIENVNNNAPKYAKENVRSPDIVETVSGEVIEVSGSSEAPLAGLKVFGRTKQLTTTGKNMLQITATTQTLHDVTFTVNDDGSVTVNGTAKDDAFFHVNNNVACLGGKAYRLTGCPKNGSVVGFYMYYKYTNTEYANNAQEGITFTPPENITAAVVICVKAGVTVNGVTFYPMLRLSDNGDDTYEPYTGGIPSPSPEYPQALESAGAGGNIKVKIAAPQNDSNTQTLLISTPNGLPGIPVSSGGNYTDANGQQWVCDEVDFEKGVYVQRIGKIDSYNGEVLPDAYISSMGELSAGATVLYQFGNDQQSYLNHGEWASYAAMHTSYPNTMVYNDAGAFMEVQYVADTKLYVDNKFNALAAMVNNA